MDIPNKNIIWTHEDLADVFGLKNLEPFSATGVSIDTRTLQKGEIYLALKGENHDGHQFVEQAFQAGAAAVIASSGYHLPALQSGLVIHVPCTQKALYDLAAYNRKRSKAVIIAITGSAGKTTTKDMLSQMLSAFGVTHKAKASFNNHIGVPLTLVNMPLNTQYGVYEIGMNHQGEIEPLARLVSPHYACITTIAEAHMGLLGSLQAIAIEKASIFYGLVDPKKAVINLESPCAKILLEAAKGSGATVLGYGLDTPNSHEAYLVLLESSKKDLKYRVKGNVYELAWQFRGKHNSLNALACFSICYDLKLDPQKLHEALAALPPSFGRGEIIEIYLDQKKITLIDESYNANPASMKAAIGNLLEATSKGRKILLLGDMLELEEFSKSYHEELADFVSNTSIDQVYTVGPLMKNHFYTKLTPSKRAVAFDNISEVFHVLVNSLQESDTLLIKGSKGSLVHKVANTLHSHKQLDFQQQRS